MNRFAIILVALMLGLAVPAISSAQLGPTNVPAPLTQPDEEVAAAAEEDNGISTLQLVLIFGAAIGVIGLIAWVIMRDARGAAPAAARGHAATEPAGPGGKKPTKSAREREREKARKRAKAKHARDQRKRNRPR